MEGAKVTAVVRKSKKKQVKDEFDRIKQAEKKKRRLEKALANSAAIRIELEKKKQKKKADEQERLEEEGAAIAEAVALHVLIDEDSIDSRETMLNKDKGPFSWVRSGNMIPLANLPSYSRENVGLWVCDACRYGKPWNQWGNSNSMISSSNHASRDLRPRYLGHECWDSIGLSADHIAAQCVSSLNIADDAARRDAYAINHMLRG